MVEQLSTVVDHVLECATLETCIEKREVANIDWLVLSQIHASLRGFLA